ncbi:MAG: preprotein translocase subunit YajC [Spirochaeta sp. LUC14_002_19_P3]|nr:MAG: preprotein translocase subunit YajC [Spirochaeta sp. LUC14_002_19_P3]
MNSIPLLMGASASGTQGSSQGSMVQIGMIVAVFAVFWFLIIRPQRKKQQETKNMLSALQKGDRVTSIGGIKGTVKNVSDNTIIVEVDSKGTTLEFTKSAIGSVDKRDSSAVPEKKARNKKEETDTDSKKES